MVIEAFADLADLAVRTKASQFTRIRTTYMKLGKVKRPRIIYEVPDGKPPFWGVQRRQRTS